ncbi:MAG TPA: AMP-binding protein [Thermoanaerobaculia bacterium]|nr:AMP-binding protein [Thermoanaerobaculia bacterium]
MTETPSPVDSLTAKAAAHPDKPAVIDDRPDGTCTTWTYRQLESAACRLANALRAEGLEPRQRVLWCGQNSPDAVAVIHAARKAGLTAVPLNYRLTPEEAAYVADDSDAVLVWVDAENAPLFGAIRDRLPKVRRVVVYGDGPAEAAGPGAIPAARWLDGHSDRTPPAVELPPKTMIYTSGTTGKPKGSVRNSTGDPEQVRRMVAHIGYRPDDVYLTTGPLYHSGPGGFMAISFLLGNTTVLQRHFDPEDWLRLVAAHRVTSTFSAPTPIRRICTLPPEVKERYDRSSLRIMIANAAPWSMALKKLYLENFPPESLWEVYGSTELGVNLILAPADQLRKPGSCGLPAPGVEVVLLDEQGRRVGEPGVQGEIFVKSPSVFDTYHKARDKYEEDRRGEYHTVGDIATFDDEGYFYICDRKKDMIISGGMNVYPAEIEAALEEHPAIYEAAVFGIPSEEWGESVHAVVVVVPGSQLGEDQVIAHARAHLAGYKTPRSVSFADELPKTGSGKVLKRQLREPFWRGAERAI